MGNLPTRNITTLGDGNRLIPMRVWNFVYPWPHYKQLGNMTIERRKEMFDAGAVQKIGKYLVVNEDAFFRWLPSYLSVAKGRRKHYAAELAETERLYIERLEEREGAPPVRSPSPSVAEKAQHSAEAEYLSVCWKAVARRLMLQLEKLRGKLDDHITSQRINLDDLRAMRDRCKHGISLYNDGSERIAPVDNLLSMLER